VSASFSLALLGRGTLKRLEWVAPMPIVAVVLLTFSFWVFYWFVRMGGIDHFRANAARRKEDARRAHARELEHAAPLRAIDDPRDAAAVLMLLIPRGGDPTRQQVASIEKAMRVVFGFEQDLIERLSPARFVAGRTDSFEHAAKLLGDLLNQRLTVAEKHELIGMIEDVARPDGPTPAQTDAIERLKARIGLLPAR
jgi:hypothetical protein